MNICLKCNNSFPNRTIIEGKERTLNKRKYCLDCSPFGQKNTKRLHLYNKNKLYHSDKNCPICHKDFKWKKNNICPTCRGLRRRQAQRIKAINYLGCKCKSCEINDPDVLTFHHTNEKTKQFTLSSNWNKSWQTILKELKKCILLCANCHMKEHRKDWSYLFSDTTT